MMKNITLAIQEDIIDEARIVAAEQKTTVNAMVRDFLKRTVARRKLTSALPEATVRDAGEISVQEKALSGHERMVQLRAEGDAKYANSKWFDREEVYDRDYQRAAQYLDNRAALLKLIDETTADMGKQKWNREALYDR